LGYWFNLRLYAPAKPGQGRSGFARCRQCHEAGTYARRLDLPLAIMDKRRHADDEKAEIQNIIGDTDGRDALLLMMKC